MNVTILGSGSAYGVPNAGNVWGACDPKNEKNRRFCASVLVEEGDSRILIDMGPDFHHQMNRFNVGPLSAVLFTHGHNDHIAGIPELARYMQCLSRDLDLFASEESLSQIQKLFPWLFNDNSADQFSTTKFYGQARPAWHTLSPGQSFMAGNTSILPLRQQHGSMESIGFRIGDFAYSTDLRSMPEESFSALSGLKLWVLEMNDWDSAHDKFAKHNYFDQAMEWIARLKPQTTILTHFSIRVDHEELSRRLPPGVIAGYDGFKVAL